MVNLQGKSQQLVSQDSCTPQRRGYSGLWFVVHNCRSILTRETGTTLLDSFTMNQSGQYGVQNMIEVFAGIFRQESQYEITKNHQYGLLDVRFASRFRVPPYNAPGN
jgi:hypothetical protein